jgi:hypothetical protein
MDSTQICIFNVLGCRISMGTNDNCSLSKHRSIFRERKSTFRELLTSITFMWSLLRIFSFVLTICFPKPNSPVSMHLTSNWVSPAGETMFLHSTPVTLLLNFLRSFCGRLVDIFDGVYGLKTTLFISWTNGTIFSTLVPFGVHFSTLVSILSTLVPILLTSEVSDASKSAPP